MPTTPSPMALAVMIAHCGWDPTELVTDRVTLLDGLGVDTLFLPSLQVTAVSAVVVTNGDGSIYTPTIDPVDSNASPTPADVSWSDNGCLQWRTANNGGRWPLGRRAVKVTWSGGYTDVPDDLAAALGNLTDRMPRIGIASRKIDTAAETYAAVVAEGGLLMIEQLVFDRYRIPRAA